MNEAGTRRADVRRVSETLGGLRANARQRIDLAREPCPAEQTARPPLRLLAGEAVNLAEPVLRLLRPPIPVKQSENPQVVVLLPGFATHPLRMRYMARQLERAGHKVKRWGLGFNFGPSAENMDMLSRRIEAIHARYGRNVVLVGWSLGGLFARELAKRHPDKVSKVVTMGSPFSQSPYDNNVWRIYQLVTGHSVAHPPVDANMREKPPVETVALWSPRDGIIAPRAACGLPGERDRAVALRCTHIGFSTSPESILAVLQELESA